MKKNAFPVTGIILAGGRSSRMGTEKGLLTVNGQTMIGRVAGAMRTVADSCIIISNTQDYHFLNLPVFPDIYPDTGPLGGIYTGLQRSRTDWNLVVACDMPFIAESLLGKLLTCAINPGVIIPIVNGQIQPLCAAYHRSLREKLQQLVRERTYKMHNVVRQLGSEVGMVDCSGTEEKKNFVNINTPVELEQIRKTYEN